MATISNTPRPGYVWDSTDNVWYPIGVGGHSHPDYITQATAVNPTLIDAKGDIITATAADTPARLAVGNNGEQIVADSSASTGLRYQAHTEAGKNFFINGGFDIWQRGTSSLAFQNAAYTADRWQATAQGGSTGVVSRQATGDTTNLPSIQYCARVQRNSGQTNLNNISFIQSLETVNSIPLAGKTVVLSFYARAGANFSATSSTLKVDLISGTGTDQNWSAFAYTGSAYPISSTATLTTTWQRFTFTGTVASTATEISTQIYYTPTGTASTNDYFEVTGVQLELGSVATNFSRAGGTIQGELAACQRYYYRATTGINGGSLAGTGFAQSTTNWVTEIQLPVTMRVSPTTLDYSNVGVYTTTQYSGGTLTIATQDSPLISGVRYVHGSAVFTAGASIGNFNSSSTSIGYLGLSAEL